MADSGTVIILGAGPAGLAAGLALARAGRAVQVYEQAAQVGGLARTLVHDGFRFDIGGHRWYTKHDALNQFLVDLLGDELLLVDRISRIYYNGGYVDYPLRARDVLPRVGPLTGARALGDFLVAQAGQRLTGDPVVSMEDAYVAQFGRTLYELFFRRYSEKVWGRACGELSGDWVVQRSRGLSLLGAVRNAISPAAARHESLVERFLYPRLGYGRISERMAEEIERAGGRVQLGWRAVGARHAGRRLLGVTLSDGRREREVEGDAYLSSIPMTELALMLRPAPERAVADACAALSYRDLITVHLMLDRPRVTADTWVYVHDPAVSFARLHEPRNWSAALAPEGRTSLVLELFCDRGDALWQRSDDDLLALVTGELSRRLGFIRPAEVLGGLVLRHRDAYPRYNLDYRAAVDAIKGYLRGLENLGIVGRGGTFRYNNTDHAIESGLLAARAILGERADPDSVNAASEYLETRPAARDRAGISVTAPEISVIIPVYNGAGTLGRCLEALGRSAGVRWECIVADDGSVDGSADVARAGGAGVLRSGDSPAGPAAARNRGALAASAPLLCFVDADVVVRPETLARFAALLRADPGLAAAFGSYDAAPAAGGLVSQYRNLLHHWVHQQGRPDAGTFWAGCGAVRRDVFLASGGFDTRYTRPCIEDIELGLRLRAAGWRIRLDRTIQVTHLKRWTLRGMLVADIRDRALPWTALIVRSGRLPADLNLDWSSRASALSIWALLGLAGLGLRFPLLRRGLPLPLGLLVWCNRRFYRFLLDRRGPRFLPGALALHWLYYAYSSLAFGVGAVAFRLRPPGGQAAREPRAP